MLVRKANISMTTIGVAILVLIVILVIIAITTGFFKTWTGDAGGITDRQCTDGELRDKCEPNEDMVIGFFKDDKGNSKTCCKPKEDACEKVGGHCESGTACPATMTPAPSGDTACGSNKVCCKT